MSDAGEMLIEHARGDGLRTIGRRHGCSHEQVRRVLAKESVRTLTQVQMDLLLAVKIESMGGVAEWPTYLVPFQEQDNWQTALSVFQWTVDRLRDAGVDVKVRSRPTPAGTAFQLTLESESS